MDKKVQASFEDGKGKPAVTKGPEGFLEGALLNKDVSAAHDKFMADVEVRCDVLPCGGGVCHGAVVVTLVFCCRQADTIKLKKKWSSYSRKVVHLFSTCL